MSNLRCRSPGNRTSRRTISTVLLAVFEQQFGGCQGCQLDGLEVNWERGGCGSGLQCAYSKSLRGAHLDNTTWKPGFNPYPPDLPGWDLSGASIVNAQGLQGADLSGANLSGATLELDLSGANFSERPARTWRRSAA